MSEEYRNWFGRLHYLHYIYIILILVMIIVGFVAYYHNDEQNLVTQVGFAASISSIILSVLAIIITVVSNGSMDRLAHGIYGLREVPENVKKSTDDAIKNIKYTTDTLKNASNDSKQGIIDMQSRFEQLFKELEQHVEDNLKTNAEQVRQMMTDMQAGTASLADMIKSDKGKDSSEKGSLDISDELIDYFLLCNSAAGNALLYAIDQYLTKEVSHVFDLKKMDEIYNNKTFSQYLYGYLIVLASFKICEFNQPSTDILEIIFISFNDNVRNKFKNRLGNMKLDKEIITKLDRYIDDLSSQDKDGDGEQKE